MTTTLTTADQAIISALEDGPKSTREVSKAILARVKEDWAERHDYDIEWGTDRELVGASLLACHEARESGFRLQPWEILPRLNAMERRGLVARIQIEGHRPMLWRAA